MLREPVSLQQKIRHGLIEWFYERGGEESVGLRIVEKAQREGVGLNDFGMNAEVSSVRSCKPCAELCNLLRQEARHG